MYHYVFSLFRFAFHSSHSHSALRSFKQCLLLLLWNRRTVSAKSCSHARNINLASKLLRAVMNFFSFCLHFTIFFLKIYSLKFCYFRPNSSCFALFAHPDQTRQFSSDCSSAQSEDEIQLENSRVYELEHSLSGVNLRGTAVNSGVYLRGPLRRKLAYLS